MTLVDPAPHHPQPDGPTRPREWAKAYCGPAHGHTWPREGSGSWPALVVLGSRTGPLEYRLVHDLRAHRPARDHLGNTLYMPAPRSDRAGRTATA